MSQLQINLDKAVDNAYALYSKAYDEARGLENEAEHTGIPLDDTVNFPEVREEYLKACGEEETTLAVWRALRALKNA